MSEKYSKDPLEDKVSEHTVKKRSFVNDNRHILKKLVCVFLLAGLFMVIEIIGGILAGSIAILSDAAHMLSDLLGFVISIVSVWISGFPANKTHSYGFHRAGVIGALGSVIVIWVLTAFLMYFAILRIIHIDEVQLEGKLMFFVACFGLITNLIMVKILHGDHGGHSHHHCHGHGHSHGHNHGHNHGHSHGHSHSHSHNHGHTHNHEHGNREHDKEHSEHKHAHKEGEEHHHHSHNHNHNHNHKNEVSHLHRHGVGFHVRAQQDHNDHDHDHNHKHGEHSHDKHEAHHHDHNRQIEKHNMYAKEAHHDHLHDAKMSAKVEREMVLIPSHSHKTQDLEKNQENLTSTSETTGQVTNLSKVSANNNLNVRATIIHIIGDILQSIGVIIGSALIWAFPRTMKLADPILTFIFAVIILFTTIRIARDCVLMLMEGTPGGFDVDEFERNIRKLEGVVELHDLHVWSLGEGKPAMSMHVSTDSEMEEVLSKTTEMCRMYGIYHSTIQVEAPKHKQSKHYIDCEHNIH